MYSLKPACMQRVPLLGGTGRPRRAAHQLAAAAHQTAGTAQQHQRKQLFAPPSKHETPSRTQHTAAGPRVAAITLIPLFGSFLATPGAADARRVCLDIPDAIADLDPGQLLHSPWAALGVALAALALLPRVIRAAARWFLAPALVAGAFYVALQHPEASAAALQVR
jgi:hypothetical protein